MFEPIAASRRPPNAALELMSLNAALPFVRTFAIAILALLCIGPVGTSLDLVLDFLPKEFPATRNLHAASVLAIGLWLASSLVGALAIFLLVRHRSVLALLATIVFACLYIPGANMVWLQFTFGCWLALAAVILAVLGLGDTHA